MTNLMPTWSVITLGTLVIVLSALLLKIMLDKSNDLECWQFIASKGADGKNYADLDKLLKLAGGAFGSWAIVKVAHHDSLDLVGFAAVLTVYFGFVGGSAGWAAYLRSKQPGDGK